MSAILLDNCSPAESNLFWSGLITGLEPGLMKPRSPYRFSVVSLNDGGVLKKKARVCVVRG